ncbi:hypothetical protein GTP46_00225 [Duganella sp. FT135W]|uniref:Uncharacterized protein n=1 Tax=Duganella flavida TaxID=2692175 RepID=A0A6L8K2D1_9BURK|nr:hypothetical protein [Duganella flavida]MYM21075.1 hypothetical protein [Duganella flavida]
MIRNLIVFGLVIIIGLVSSVEAYADMPPMERKKTEQTFRFGAIKIVQSFNSIRDPKSPEFKVRVFKGDKLLLQLSDAFCGNFFAAPNQLLFVGLSNTGWPGTAVIVFDDSGRILLLADHNAAQFDYCEETPTLLKQWYDDKNPEVQFHLPNAGKEIKPSISVRDCRGGTVDLLDAVLNANARGEKTIHDAIELLLYIPKRGAK